MAKRKVYGPDAQDIRRAAYSMLANHGSNAAEIALRRARNLDVASESRGVWERVFATLTEMQHPGTGALA
jgi:uncharacterized membrane protein